MEEIMNKRELINSIAEKTGYTQTVVRKVLNTFIETLYEEMQAENKVRIGGLGVFAPVARKIRPVRNPQTLEPLMLAPRNTIKFRAADDLIRRLNGEEWMRKKS